ncbi:hypothetical protein ACFQRC_07300 [Enterovirga sp. GCM10030262]|uniref:hypothetical protein n=1 Tax=Enterovirga sp. GCM10030262 TaxID=3273391 RepID=UPI003614126A
MPEADARPMDFETTTPSPLRGDPGRRLQSAFLLAALIGFIAALLGLVPQVAWAGFAGPLVTIVGFYWWGHHAGLDDRGDTRQRFADSCYFLGFLLTMSAMLIGFFPAGMLGHELTSQGILRHFSMALGATALGLVFRIVALQGGRSIDEDVAEVEAELRDYARTVSREARAIGVNLAEARAGLAAHGTDLATFVSTEARAALGQALDTLRTSASEIAAELAVQSAALRASAHAIDETVRARAVELGDAESRSAEAGQRLETSLVRTADAAGALHDALATLQIRVAASIGEATGAITRLSVSFEAAAALAPDLESRAGDLDTRLTAVHAGLAAVESGVDRIEAGVGAAGTALTAAASRVEATAVKIDSEGEVALDRLREATAAAGERIAALGADAIDRLGRESAERLNRQFQEGQDVMAPLRAQADEFERRIAAATGAFTTIVDRFAADLAALHREVNQR